MNDIYLSLKPIYEHFKVCNRYPTNYINRFLKFFDGCYCFHVHKIVINTKIIIEDNADINMIIDHEVMHYILHKHFGNLIRSQWDNISTNLEKYLWLNR